MDIQTQLSGLDTFLSAIYGSGTNLVSLLTGLGFEASQRKSLEASHLPAIAAGMVEATENWLKWGDKDTWYRLTVRRFGLDGEPGVGIEAAAVGLGLDPEYARQAAKEALDKCRTKSGLEYFKKELHRIALAELAKSGEKPAKEQVVSKLKRLGDLHAAADIARLDYESKRAEVLKKVQAELDAIEVEFRPVLDAAEDNAEALEAEIKNDVLLRGESLRGGPYQAVYVKGRVSWDSKGIDDYARSHPDLLKYRKQGQPSVSLRPVSESGSPKSD